MITLLNSADAAYPAMAELYKEVWQVREQVAAGFYVQDLSAAPFGGTVQAGTTTGTIKVNPGTDSTSTGLFFYSTTDNVPCVVNADANLPRFMWVEMDASGAVFTNVGAAAALPIPPLINTTRVMHALIYLPPACSAVDTIVGTANGNAKIMDMRAGFQRAPRHQAHNNGATRTNPTTFTSLLTATLPLGTFFAVGDFIRITATGSTLNNTATSTFSFQGLIGANVIFNYTSAALTVNSFPRMWKYEADIYYAGFGSQTISTRFTTGSPSVNNGGAVTDHQLFISTGNFFAGTSLFDLQARYNTSSTGANINCVHAFAYRLPGV